MSSPLVRGHVAMAALWFPPGHSEPAAVLREWHAGAQATRVHGGILLRFAAPKHRPSQPGYPFPLVECAGGLSVGPKLPPDAPSGSVVLVWQGATIVVVPSQFSAIPLASWLNLGNAKVIPAFPLGPTPTPAPAPSGFDVRVALGRPRATAEAKALSSALLLPKSAKQREISAGSGILAAMAGALLGGIFGQRGSGTPASGRPTMSEKTSVNTGDALRTSGNGGLMFAIVGGLLAGLAGLFGGRRDHPTSAPTHNGRIGSAPPPPPAPPSGPGWWTLALRRLAAPLWNPVLGGAHGRYLAKMLDLFESDNLDEALRHAIPLGDHDGPVDPPAFSLPNPRDSLKLGPLVQRRTSAIGLETGVFEHLRQVYERALKKLIDEKRIDEAVFLLVELLRWHGEAVELLEANQRFELAAKIAEAHLAPSLAVRLWMLAENPEAAVLLARRTGSFGQTITLLQPKHPELALRLRQTWAEHLAASGDFAAACTIAWEEPALRPGAVRWLDAALAVGGTGGARLIAHLLRGRPQLFEAAKERILALLTGEGYEFIALRIAAAEGLLSVGSDERLPLLRPLYRQLVADQAAHPEFVPLARLSRIRDALREPALIADAPPAAPQIRRLTDHPKPIEYAFDAGDRGSVGVSDLWFSAEHGLLVALGEVGARVYARDGRVRAAFDEPMSHLVVPSAGATVVGIAHRDWGKRLAKLDLTQGRGTRWHDANYGLCAPTSDGSLWFVAEGNSLIALDLLASRARSLWRVNALPAAATQIAVDAQSFSALLGETDRERWVHALPALRLSERRITPDPPERQAGIEWMAPYGTLHQVHHPRAMTPDDTRLSWQVVGPDGQVVRSTMLPLAGPAGAVREARRWKGSLAEEYSLAVTTTPSGLNLWLWIGETLRMVVRLDGSGEVAVRATGDMLAVGDNLGRALVFELISGTLLRNVRVR